MFFGIILDQAYQEYKHTKYSYTKPDPKEPPIVRYNILDKFLWLRNSAINRVLKFKRIVCCRWCDHQVYFLPREKAVGYLILYIVVVMLSIFSGCAIRQVDDHVFLTVGVNFKTRILVPRQVS